MQFTSAEHALYFVEYVTGVVVAGVVTGVIVAGVILDGSFCNNNEAKFSPKYVYHRVYPPFRIKA